MYPSLHPRAPEKSEERKERKKKKMRPRPKGAAKTTANSNDDHPRRGEETVTREGKEGIKRFKVNSGAHKHVPWCHEPVKLPSE